MSNPKVSKTTYPEKQPPQDEWCRQYGVASAYRKPTPYYGGNDFNTRVFSGRPARVSRSNWFGKITEVFFNILNKKTWVG
jgi:hypothetical protein